MKNERSNANTLTNLFIGTCMGHFIGVEAVWAVVIAVPFFYWGYIDIDE